MAAWIPSPNYSSGRGGKRVDRIVCHWIVGTLATADAVFKNAANQVSAHYGVGNNEVHQYVRETDTAWHAGNFDVNQRSIGIEHQGGPSLPISDATYETSAALIADIWRRYGQLPLVPHRSIVATQCPGNLDLSRLASRASQLIGGSPVNDQADYGFARELSVTVLLRQAPMSEAEYNQYHKGKTRLQIYSQFANSPESVANRQKFWTGGTSPKSEALKKALVEFLA